MTEKGINIKSSTLEKGLDLAKDFLGKLISPTIEEVGLLISDNIKFLRFKNQIRILLKAKEYVEKRKINIKEIPIKILVPLLENASLEENEILQDKWAKMLTNLIDSESNLQNQIFPYLLSQISVEEYNGLKKLSEMEKGHSVKRKDLIESMQKEKMRTITERIENKYSIDRSHDDLKKEVDIVEQGGFNIELEGFEISNIQRLGLIRQLPPRILIEEFKTGNNFSPYDKEEWHQIEAQYEPDEFGYRITELGEKFLKICELTERE